MFVELQERDARRVGTPPVRAKVAAAIEFFLVDPIQAAIQQLGIPITSQRVLTL